MHKPSTRLARRQTGFTLIELVIVIVILGILAAVAIPNLSSAADDARIAKASATLGALKSAYAIVYSTTKAAPTCAAVATAVPDPACSATGTVITCAGVKSADGTANATFTCAGATLANTADLTCTVGANCV
jgi:MSHA pilin protein MshA